MCTIRLNIYGENDYAKLVFLSISTCSAVLIGGTAILASCSNYSIKQKKGEKQKWQIQLLCCLIVKK